MARRRPAGKLVPEAVSRRLRDVSHGFPTGSRGRYDWLALAEAAFVANKIAAAFNALAATVCSDYRNVISKVFSDAVR